MSQSTNHILMIRPVSFGYNAETAESNAFQIREDDQLAVQNKAVQEFDGFVHVLRDNGVDVTVIDDTVEPHTPDSIFPNNWVSFHTEGDIILYPMQAENRRMERREDIIRQLEERFAAKHIVDLSRFEFRKQYLEGTGSMVLDRVNKIAYACLSPRTDAEVLKAFCEYTGYTAVTFDAHDQNGKAIYHTNVLMCVGTGFAVVCLASIRDELQRDALMKSLSDNGKELVDITFDQMNRFAGNMLELKSEAGETLIVMSKTAFEALEELQRSSLAKYGKIVYSDINTIETNGGGSARCMMAEVHLPRLT